MTPGSGNEYIEDLELRWMDFNFRFYDPQIGRFLSPDPLGDYYGQDRFSPYAAMGNQPESMVDPDGLRMQVGDGIIPAMISKAGYLGEPQIEGSMSEGTIAFMLNGLSGINNWGDAGGGGGNFKQSSYSGRVQSIINQLFFGAIVRMYGPGGGGGNSSGDASGEVAVNEPFAEREAGPDGEDGAKPPTKK